MMRGIGDLNEFGSSFSTMGKIETLLKTNLHYKINQDNILSPTLFFIGTYQPNLKYLK
jgi:hypothetical protein